MLKLETKPKALHGKDLIGHEGKVYLCVEPNRYIITVNNSISTIEYPAKSENDYKVGDSVVISDYVNAYYII
jgi:membrane protein implicated in regulation of membrane protease activity